MTIADPLELHVETWPLFSTKNKFGDGNITRIRRNIVVRSSPPLLATSLNHGHLSCSSGQGRSEPELPGFPMKNSKTCRMETYGFNLADRKILINTLKHLVRIFLHVHRHRPMHKCCAWRHLPLTYRETRPYIFLVASSCVRDLRRINSNRMSCSPDLPAVRWSKC